MSANARPIVSVVLITHNCATYLPVAVRSVLSQSVQNLELIVVDDGSTDDTASTLSVVQDERLRYIKQANAGPNSARNNGLGEARGEFIAFLDCDDWWGSLKLEHQLARMAAQPEAGLVYSLAIRVNEDGTESGRFDSALEGNLLGPLLLGNCISGSASSAMIRRRVIESVGVFDESLQFAEDWEYWIRISSAFPIVCASEFDVYLLSRAGSRGKQPGRVRDDSLRFIGESVRRYAPNRTFRGKALGRVHYVASHDFNALGRRWRARWELAIALAHDPLNRVYYKRMAWLCLPRVIVRRAT